MTDYWSRSGGSSQPDFEITLDGGGGAWGGPTPTPVHDDGDAGDERSGRNWGAIVGIAALAAISLVVAGGVIFQTGDDAGSADDAASTTMQLEQPPAAAVATSAPSTPSAGDLGDFDTPEQRYPPMVSAPTPNQQQIPGFPHVPGSEDRDLTRVLVLGQVRVEVPPKLDKKVAKLIFDIFGVIDLQAKSVLFSGRLREQAPDLRQVPMSSLGAPVRLRTPASVIRPTSSMRTPPQSLR